MLSGERNRISGESRRHSPGQGTIQRVPQMINTKQYSASHNEGHIMVHKGT